MTFQPLETLSNALALPTSSNVGKRSNVCSNRWNGWKNIFSRWNRWKKKNDADEVCKTDQRDEKLVYEVYKPDADDALENVYDPDADVALENVYGPDADARLKKCWVALKK